MKVAITGAAGYVGSPLVRAHAARGDAVHAVARTAESVPALPGVTAYAADVTMSEAIPHTFFEGADVVGTIAREVGRAGRPPRIPETPARIAAQIARLVPAFPLTASRVDALTSRVEYRTDRIERELGFRHDKSIADALRDLAALWKRSAQ